MMHLIFWVRRLQVSVISHYSFQRGTCSWNDNQIKENEMGAGHTACMKEKSNAYRDFVGKPKGKRPLGRPRHR
jgi:hypothetical protein